MRARLVAAVLDLLAPPRCLACRARAVPPWCPACTVRISPGGATCGLCGAPRGGHRCWPAGVPISSTRVVHDYRGPVSRAVVTAKLGGAHAGWPALGGVLAAHVAADPPAVDVVTWVTTAPARRRRRGTDHAAVLAAAVGERIDVPVVPLLRVATHAGEERLRASRHLPGSEVLLVDDVLTTGATAVAAASELLRAGAGRIHLAVLARAGTHALVDGGQDGPGPHDPEGRGGPARVTRSGGRKPSVGRTAGLDSPHAASGAPDGTHRR